MNSILFVYMHMNVNSILFVYMHMYVNYILFHQEPFIPCKSCVQLTL